jgi:tetratricopeptide (TPR) repeat protein
MQPPTQSSDASATPAVSAVSAAPTPRKKIFLLALALAVAAWLAYANTFSVPFLFDDALAITGNPSIEHFWSSFFPPNVGVAGVVGRPVVNFSLAVNYWLARECGFDGRNVWGYHVMNLLIHIGVVWALFGVLHRTLLRAPLRARFGEAAMPLAFIVTLVWAVHPLLTETVTCVVQRNEAMMSFFYLMTLYCFIRGAESPRPAWWHIGGFAMCLVGMGAKEAMVSAPLAVLLYDRTFVAGTFLGALRSRWWHYLALAGTWIFLAVLMHSTDNRSGTVGFGLGMSWWSYALKQCDAIWTYLKLSFWPRPLVVDYGELTVDNWRTVIWQMELIVGLVVGTGYALWRWPAVGFAAGCFLMILAPSSSVVPLTTQTMAEHRMYLPLAAVLSIVGLTVYAWAGRRTIAAGLVIAAALAALTFARNRDYHSELALWYQDAEDCPENYRAFYNYGCAQMTAGRDDEALAQFDRTLALNPKYDEAHTNLGSILAQRGQLDDAIAQYQMVVDQIPDDSEAQYDLGCALLQNNELQEALECFQTAVSLSPDYVKALTNLGYTLMQMGEPHEAYTYLKHAIDTDPNDPDAQSNYGAVLLALGETNDAASHLEQSLDAQPDSPETQVRLAQALDDKGDFAQALPLAKAAVAAQPDDAKTHFVLGNVLFGLNRAEDAVAEFKEAVRLNPNYPEAETNLGDALARAGNLDDAIAAFTHALELKPDFAEAEYSFGNALLKAGQNEEAITHYTAALKINPDYPEAENNLGSALLRLKRPAEAMPHFQKALTLKPDYADAQKNLDALQKALKAN